MIKKPAPHRWKAEKYSQHSSVQKHAATEILQKIEFGAVAQVLDVGCGDGKISMDIARSIPGGDVLGIDSSSEMIEFASRSFSKSQYPNLSFLVQDAADFHYEARFDVIFSSFALQWLKQPENFFKCAYESLKNTGCLVATIPLDISDELHDAVEIIMAKAQWSGYFENFSPGWHFIPTDNYRELLRINGFETSYFSMIPQVKFFETRNELEDYILPWFSYLQPLPPEQKLIFFEQVIDLYLENCPFTNTGSVSFRFNRLDFIAKKINP